MARSPASAESLVEKSSPAHSGRAGAGGGRGRPPAPVRPRGLCPRFAWENTALPIGAGQTISQPVVVARMCEVLELRRGREGARRRHRLGLSRRRAGPARPREVWSIEREPRLSRAGAAQPGGGRDRERAPDRGRRLARLPARRRRTTRSTSRRPHTDVPPRRSRSSSPRAVAWWRRWTAARPAPDAGAQARRRRSSARGSSRSGSCRSSARLSASPAALAPVGRARLGVRRATRRSACVGVGVDVRVDLLRALVSSVRPLALGLRALRALLGLGGLAARPRGLLVGRRACSRSARVCVQAGVAAVLVRLAASLLACWRALRALRRHERRPQAPRRRRRSTQSRLPCTHAAPSLGLPGTDLPRSAFP